MGTRAAGPGAAALALGFGFQTLGLVAVANVAPKLNNPFDGDFLTKCPLDLEHERARKERPKDEVYGAQRVTRHPTFWTLESPEILTRESLLSISRYPMIWVRPAAPSRSTNEALLVTLKL